MQKIHTKQVLFLIIMFLTASCSTTNDRVYYTHKSAFNHTSYQLISNYSRILTTSECIRNPTSDAIIFNRSSDSCFEFEQFVDSNVINEIFLACEIRSIMLSPNRVLFHFNSDKRLLMTITYSLLYTEDASIIDRYYNDKDFSITSIDTNWYLIKMNYDD